MTITKNAALNGIEVSFPSKPAASIIEALKAQGFRWHRKKALWYAKSTPERLEAVQRLEDQPAQLVESKAVKSTPSHGVKVGDLFSITWGYEQTNNDFFQVIALVGKQSVRIRQVSPEVLERIPCSHMSEDVRYKVPEPGEMLPPCNYSVFIKDEEKGDIKRLTDTAYGPAFRVEGHLATLYKGETLYNSWYA